MISSVSGDCSIMPFYSLDGSWGKFKSNGCFKGPNLYLGRAEIGLHPLFVRFPEYAVLSCVGPLKLLAGDYLKFGDLVPFTSSNAFW